MKTKTKTSFFIKNQDKLVVILIIAICSVMAFFSKLEKIEYKFYDALLGLHKNPETRNELLIVEIDNDSTTIVGEWPWSRDIYANQLIRMKELGAETAVFDIEFLSPSHMIVTDDDKKRVDTDFKDFTNNLDDLESDDFISSYFNMEKSLQSLFRSNDDYFAKGIQYFGNTWLTVNINDIAAVDESTEEKKKKHELEKQFAYDYLLYNNVTDNSRYIEKNNIENLTEQKVETGFYPALHEFISHSTGAGFTNVFIDKDGTRRRLELLKKEGPGNTYVAQLAFSPLIKKYNIQHIIREKKSLELIGVKKDNSEERYNIKIPLDKQGRLLINWKHELFKDSFRHTKIFHLNELDIEEKNITNLLENLAYYYVFADGASFDLSYSQQAAALLEEHAEIMAFKEALLDRCLGYTVDKKAIQGGLSEDDFEAYFEAHKAFFEHVNDYLNSDYFDELYDWIKLVIDIEGGFDFSDMIITDENCLDLVTEINDQVNGLSKCLFNYNDTFEKIEKEYKGSFCLIGQTTSSSTDLGTTPFEKLYPNIGTHANVYNTIMTQDFITPLPWFVGIIIASILALVLAFFANDKKVGAINIAGIIILVIIIAVPILAMIFGGYYIQMLWPTVLVFVSFITIDILHFFTAEKDKSFLKHAFATYLNPKSVNEIIEHPEKLSLGGEQKHLTALFSDIQKFSSFSESVTPEKLVAVLQTYLGKMSDCILADDGTIDKYEGDAIIAFFGAPAEVDNGAYRACASAIRMKQAEKLYNEENTKTGFIDRELNTRIGINTGEMVVGNMGTDKKFNYTIMGNDVNLASRLEGVNKAYKSWILCSETTWNEANFGKYKGKIVARRFDRVRVINIDRPVQLYNILGFRDEMTDIQLKAVDTFEKAIELYLERQFTEAAELFIQANKMVPEDESPLVFAERCKNYATKGVPENWSGVFVMNEK